jgi:hypothetical protein
MLQAKVQEQADTATPVVSTDVERCVPWPIRPRPARAFFWGLSGCSITWKHAFWNRKVGDNAWAYNEHRLLHLLGRYSCYVKLHSAAALMAPSPAECSSTRCGWHGTVVVHGVGMETMHIHSLDRYPHMHLYLAFIHGNHASYVPHLASMIDHKQMTT